jgi:hypothetical protein
MSLENTRVERYVCGVLDGLTVAMVVGILLLVILA